MKFGIYSSPGTKTCGGFLGSLGHERMDASTYAAWGLGYLKYDLCSYSDISLATPLFSRSKNLTSLCVKHSVCNLGILFTAFANTGFLTFGNGALQ
ncbi:hypothetical protein [Mucilaginibacter sp. KACC 22063]|uniref:hypothetical protein n=1 Tax=Mucilaginibacter sp. KACC 22063 TaxID=3025666 RepID=UPI003FD26E12